MDKELLKKCIIENYVGVMEIDNGGPRSQWDTRDFTEKELASIADTIITDYETDLNTTTIKTDVSIHFTIKDQNIKDIASKLDAYLNGENLKNPKFDFSERQFVDKRNVLHHCFLPEGVVREKGFSTEVYDDILDLFSEDKVCWYDASGLGLIWDRQLMFENLKKVNGMAIFLGEIKEGVEEEYKIAQELEIECILIP